MQGVGLVLFPAKNNRRPPLVLFPAKGKSGVRYFFRLENKQGWWPIFQSQSSLVLIPAKEIAGALPQYFSKFKKTPQTLPLKNEIAPPLESLRRGLNHAETRLESR